jgi:hypothetical protein
MSFIAAAVIGYILAFVPGFPGAEIPPAGHIYTAQEYQLLNVGDALGGAVALLFLICGAFGVVCGTVGGFVGSLLEGTGDGRDVSPRT